MNRPKQQHSTQVLVIGAGPAGLSCALWCRQLNLRFLVLEAKEKTGGQLHRVYNLIKDWPGHIGTGHELWESWEKQRQDLGIEVHLGQKVVKVDWEQKKVITSKACYEAQAIVLATGLANNQLKIPGIESFVDKQIFYSASACPEAFRGKKTVVIGGGDGALENALFLAEICPQVVLVHRGKEFRARADFCQKVLAHPAIEVKTENEVTSFNGQSRLESITLSQGQTIPVERALIKIGQSVQNELLQTLSEDEKKNLLWPSGHVKVNHNQQTNLPGVWAVGDVCTPQWPSLCSCVGSASVAIKHIQNLLVG